MVGKASDPVRDLGLNIYPQLTLGLGSVRRDGMSMSDGHKTTSRSSGFMVHHLKIPLPATGTVRMFFVLPYSTLPLINRY